MAKMETTAPKAAVIMVLMELASILASMFRGMKAKTDISCIILGSKFEWFKSVVLCIAVGD